MTYSEAKRLVKRVFVVLVLIAAAIYGGDYLWLQLRLESKNPDAAMDNLTRYDSTMLKNGKVEVFYGQPEVQKCVRSLLPHLGYEPCWYLKRAGKDIKQISFLRSARNPRGAREFYSSTERMGKERFLVAALLGMTTSELHTSIRALTQ